MTALKKKKLHTSERLSEIKVYNCFEFNAIWIADKKIGKSFDDFAAKINRVIQFILSKV